MSVALTIAGSDPSGGAGLQADLKTFHQHRVYGMSVVTLMTIQNTQRVSGVSILEPAFVNAQLQAVVDDIPPAAAKTGALGNAAVIEVVAAAAQQFRFPLVVDPVMISKHGDSLIDPAAVDALRQRLLPQAFLVTPNAREAACLAGREARTAEELRDLARAVADLGARNVLLKSGNQGAEARDLLFSGGEFYEFNSPRIQTRCLHGTGCVLSAAITARLARGEDLRSAVAGAKQFVAAAIASGPGLGRGISPVNFFTEPA
ncbi:MAG: bifunctional hydroxymethylpyrimidine kinase/phosphomethylpyrimidine kinase [Planctomycetota bacterium]|nr:bifunctional hydroxymethylpyrimidine kinase/phosphomethylpyrimidine kinase [Blastopirellula sp.]